MSDKAEQLQQILDCAIINAKPQRLHLRRWKSLILKTTAPRRESVKILPTPKRICNRISTIQSADGNITTTDILSAAADEGDTHQPPKKRLNAATSI